MRKSPNSRSLLDYAGYIFDLDGTIYLGPYLLPGVGQMLAELRDKGRRIRFLSNKPLQSRLDYAEKLRRLGVQAGDHEVINSSVVATRYILQHFPDARVYVLGEGPLILELVEAGVKVVDESMPCDLILLSFDRNFHYLKLHHAMTMAMRGVPLIATNPDVTCPTAQGPVPDCGAIIAAVEACSGQKVQAIVGKPSRLMLQTILDDIGLPVEEALMTGDRLETDIEMGYQAGLPTALVLTGVATLEDALAWPHPPTYILSSAADILRGAPEVHAAPAQAGKHS